MQIDKLADVSGEPTGGCFAVYADGVTSKISFEQLKEALVGSPAESEGE